VVHEGHKSEVSYYKWHLYQVSFTVHGSLKSIYDLKGSPSRKAEKVKNHCYRENQECNLVPHIKAEEETAK